MSLLGEKGIIEAKSVSQVVMNSHTGLPVKAIKNAQCPRIVGDSKRGTLQEAPRAGHTLAVCRARIICNWRSHPMHRTIALDFNRSSLKVARALIGVVLLVDGVGGRIVETEAYDEDEPASHAYRGLRPHNASLFGPAGHAYVYRSYGIHWCLNFVCRAPGHGAGVLIRALEPAAGIDVMRRRRGIDDERLLCAGPGRLGKALGIGPEHDGLPLNRPPFELQVDWTALPVVTGVRIGISKAEGMPWRFGLAGSRFVSRRFD
jgi:DNA-3-methyladenine glycosylase